MGKPVKRYGDVKIQKVMGIDKIGYRAIIKKKRYRCLCPDCYNLITKIPNEHFLDTEEIGFGECINGHIIKHEDVLIQLM